MAFPQADRIDALCAPFVQEGGPGLSLAVLRDGAVVYRKALGLASLEHDVPITVDTVFETASVSKQVTAFAVHLLIEDGRLSLDDDVRDHVPALPDFGTPITVRHCLHHTSGLRDWVGFGHRLTEDVSTSSHVLRWLMRQTALNHAPGAEFVYTNTGYFVLAQVVEAVAEGSFAAFCRERIFDPLGMANTHFRETLDAVIKHRADSYYRAEDGAFIPCISSQAVPGATSMQTTIDDMVRWLGNFETGTVGSPGMLEAMHRSGVLEDGQVTRYASGLELDTHGGEKIVFHTGGWAGYVSLMVRVPAKRLAFVVLSNSGDFRADDFSRSMLDLLFGDEASKEEVAQTALLSAPLSEFVGTYSGPGGPVIEISEREGALRTGAVGGDSVALVPLGGLRCHPLGHPDTVIEFQRDEAGRIAHYRVRDDGFEQSPRIRIEPETGAVDLGEFVGTYYSRELEVGYRFFVEDGSLTLGSIVHGDEPLRQVGRDLFIDAEPGPMPEIFTFERDAKGKVEAVLLSVSDARNQRLDIICSSSSPTIAGRDPSGGAV